MASQRPKPEIPEFTSIPVFPLPDIVVFPGADVPLHFFEPRYRALAEDVVAGNGLFATVRLEPGYELDYEGSPRIKRIGTLGRVVAHRPQADGTHDVVFRGLCRGVLEETAPSERGYRLASIKILDDLGLDRISPPSISTLLSCAQSLVSLIRKRQPDFSLGLERLDSPSDLVDALSHRIVFAPDDRQRLLEMRDVRERVTRLVDVIGEMLLRFGTKQSSQN